MANGPNCLAEENKAEGSSSISHNIAENCPICLSVFKNNQLIATPDVCKHIFCTICLQEWSKKTNTCPVDRHKFKYLLVKRATISSPSNTLTIGKQHLKKIPVANKDQEDDQTVLEEYTYCEVCRRCDREETLLLCDGCDRGFHCECLRPRLNAIPVGLWFCARCIDERSAQLHDLLLNEDDGEEGEGNDRHRIDNVIDSVIASADTISTPPRRETTTKKRRRRVLKRRTKRLRRRRRRQRRTTKTSNKKTSKKIVKKYRVLKSKKRGSRTAVRPVVLDAKKRILRKIMEISKEKAVNERLNEKGSGMAAATFGASIMPTNIMNEVYQQQDPSKYNKDYFAKFKADEPWFQSRSIFYEVEAKDPDSLSLASDFYKKNPTSSSSIKQESSKDLKPTTTTSSSSFLDSILMQQKQLFSKKLPSQSSHADSGQQPRSTTQEEKAQVRIFKTYDHLLKEKKVPLNKSVSTESFKSSSSPTKQQPDDVSHNKEEKKPSSESMQESASNMNVNLSSLQNEIVECAKSAIKPHYARKSINKDEYKTIMKKVVTKVLHNCKSSGKFDPVKVSKLVDDYVAIARATKPVKQQHQQHQTMTNSQVKI